MYMRKRIRLRKALHTTTYKIIGQLMLKRMFLARLRNRQIFKFGLLRKKIIRKI
jgi:hypothetical protein